jgi:peptidoglycan glycosyltransferase
LTLALAAGFALVVLATGYWQIVRAPDLLARVDNPRRVLIERRVPRGTLYDRNGAVLADAAGQPGAWVRHYPYPALAPVLGYVSPQVGSAGIEAALDPVLHGDGSLDPFTIYWRTSVLGTPPPGRAARLTLDLRLQQVADTALGANAGAAVLLQVETGEVLALASHPTFDANNIDDHWQDLVNNPGSPLLNRATLGLYQPGGALAPVIVAGALQANLIDPQQTLLRADQAVTVDGQPLGCQTGQAQPEMTISDTLALGCPGPLAALGGGLGTAGLQKLFTQFQFFSAPGLTIPTTAPSATKAASDPHPDLAAIGQGVLTVTPLQMALVTAALANHGLMPTPQLVLQTQNPDLGWHTEVTATAQVAVVAPAVADEVRALLPNGLMATAITGSGGKALAWFMGFGPFASPQYAVVVILESGDPRTARDIGQALLAAAATS